jgi:DNA invertase Pin-like site-specific DNA recombinase
MGFGRHKEGEEEMTNLKSKVAAFLSLNNTENTKREERDFSDFIRNLGINEFELYEDKVADRSFGSALEKLLLRLEGGEINTIIARGFSDLCSEFDNEDELISFLFKLSERRIRFISANENIDKVSSDAGLMLNFLSAYRAQTSYRRSENVRKGLLSAKEKGKLLGRPAKRDVQKIRELREKGMTIQQIAEALKLSVGSVHKSLA